MKRITTLFLCIVLAVVTYGQSNEVHALVKVYTKFDTTAAIDFGDGGPRMAFADEKGKTRKFKTSFEPINLLLKERWEIEQFSIMMNGSTTITSWVIKKKIDNESEIKRGMTLIESNA